MFESLLTKGPSHNKLSRTTFPLSFGSSPPPFNTWVKYQEQLTNPPANFRSEFHPRSQCKIESIAPFPPKVKFTSAINPCLSEPPHRVRRLYLS
jgi:hypothetical protein